MKEVKAQVSQQGDSQNIQNGGNKIKGKTESPKEKAAAEHVVDVAKRCTRGMKNVPHPILHVPGVRKTDIGR